MKVCKTGLLLAAITLAPVSAFAATSPCEVQDQAEDAVESAGSFIEDTWEGVEDAVITETDEERREEAAERRADAAEEAQEQGKCGGSKQG